MIARGLPLAVWLIAASVPVHSRTAAQDPPVFRAASDAVSVNVSVQSGNNPVSGLHAGDFRLTDNGVLQHVQAVSVEAVPIDLTLFLDTSPSFAGRLEDLREDVVDIAGLLRPGDRIRVLAFGGFGGVEVDDTFGWQPAGTTLDLARLKRARISPVNDGILTALLHRPASGRRHLVVAMTDAVDAGSLVSATAVRDASRRLEGVLHLIEMRSSRRADAGAPGSWPSGGFDRDGAGPLRDAAELTGGRVHATLFRLNVVERFKQAFEDFRTSYVLHYAPAGVEDPGWHEITVTVPSAPRATIRARRGYVKG